MAASAWIVFDQAKHNIGAGAINLSAATHTFRLSLHRTAASANLVGDITVFTSVGNECSGGGYVARTLAGVSWGAGVSAGIQQFDVTDPVITASASVLSAVRYAVIRKSAGTTTSGLLLCYAALSTAEFDVQTGNTLTIQMAATGIFTLA